MTYNKKQIKKILASETDKDLKNNLKIQDEENFIERLFEIYIDLVNDIKEEYIPILEIILQEIENQTDLLSDDFIEMTKSIIQAREKIKDVKTLLEEKITNNDQSYPYIWEDNERICEIENKLDRLIKKAKIVKKTNNKKEEVTSLIEYLKVQIENIDENNVDVINKILTGLEYLSNKELIIEKEEIISLKKTTKKVNKTNKLIKNESIYIYKKLEQIEENILKPEEKIIRFETKSFDKLVEELDEITDEFSVNKAKLAYKIIERLEEKIKKPNPDKKYDYNKLLKIRQKIIANIKNTPKITRQKTKYIYLKEIANKIENIELNIIYNTNSEETIKNYNIINYIIFNKQDVNCTENIIEKNPYLINAYSLTTENIIMKTVNKYLEAINGLSKKESYKDLCYFDKVLNLLLTNEIICYDEKVINECLKEVEKKINQTNKNKIQVLEWYKRLEKILSKQAENIETDSLNKMFNISDEEEPVKEFNIIIKDEKETGPFIFTIDDEKTTNRDDAISIKEVSPGLNNLRIYISDPGYILKKESPEMKKAKKQGETLYLQDKSIEMFSEETIQKHLSLDANKKRAVKVYDYLLSNDGELISFAIQKESIVTDQNYSYQEFNEILRNSSSYKQEELIEKLLLLEKILNKQIFEEKEAISVNPNDSSKENSELLITTYMIYNNYKVAEYFAKEKLPFIYRHYSSETNIDQEILKRMSIFETKTANKIIDELGKVPGHASYSVNEQNHDGLSISSYSHITSPNRRYADILASECIDKLYFNNLNDSQIRVFEKYLSREVETLNDRLIANQMYTEEYNKILKRK